MSILTTITPFWGRPEMLLGWVRCIRAASIPEVKHFIYFVGERPPDWWATETGDLPIVTFLRSETDPLSIGHYHNIGIAAADSPWVMKMDIDTIPNIRFFSELLPVLASARPRQWFNSGMLYVSEASTKRYLATQRLPLTEFVYTQISSNSKAHSASTYILPSATNFICRKNDYLNMGGCLEGFKGYGWEDYMQIYGLEKQYQGTCPLRGVVTMESVTRFCRDQISRVKAEELWRRNNWLCLLHRFHHPSKKVTYRSHDIFEHNRKILYDYVTCP